MRGVLALLIIANIMSGSTLEHAQSLRAAGQKEEALAAFEQCIRDDPDHAHAHYEYATYLIELDETHNYAKTIELLKQACSLKQDLQWQFFLGCQACRYGHLDLSVTTYKNILEKYPNQLGVFYNLGYTLKCQEKMQQAIAIYKTIIKDHPDYESAHLGLAFAYIGIGDFESGWKEHEWNLKKQGKYAPELRALIANNDLEGKRILLRPEGGLGDSINFVRYVQLLKHRGAHTIVAVQKPLIPLLRRCDYIDELIATHESFSATFHASATLMSLAPIFAETQKNISQNIPYVFADPERIAYWHEHLKQDTNIKIGICWQPSIHNDVSRLPIARRGIPLSYFYELGSTPGITLYSLQRVEGLEQLSELPDAVNLIAFDEHFDTDHGSFMDTAAIMHSLDLIISADTATAHLAGAMGRPVWLLLPYVTDWRWLAKRSDSPWYPTMRIFKQHKPFDWDSAMNDLYEAFFNELLQKRNRNEKTVFCVDGNNPLAARS